MVENTQVKFYFHAEAKKTKKQYENAHIRGQIIGKIAINADKAIAFEPPTYVEF